MGTSDSPRLWLTSVTPPKFDSTSGPDLNSVSSVPIVKSTRRRTILEVVIQLKGVRPAYRTASSGSGTSFGDVAEDQAITKGQSRKEGINRDAEDDKDYDGDVDGDVEMNEDEMYHNHDNYQVNRHQTGHAVASPSNERYQGGERGAAAHSSEITAVHRTESIDLDLDSPSSCVTSSCSSDSEDDDLCSIDDTDLTDDLERSDKLELDGDDGNSVFGRVSHVSCSVDESSDEDEAYHKRLRSSAPSPPVLVIHPIVQPLVNVLETPASPCFKTLDSKIKLEGGESTAVMDRTMSSQAHTPPSVDIIPSLSSSPMSPLPIPMRSASMSSLPISMPSSQQTADGPKARKYARLRLEVSLPHPSLRKRTASAQKGNATRIVVKEGSQACQLGDRQLGDRNYPLKQGWNNGWPGQWEAGNNVATASNLMITVEGMQSDTLRNGEVSQDVLGRETSLDEEVKDGLVVPMEVDGCRLPLTPLPLPTRPTLSPPSTLPTLPPFQDNRHTYPTANTADAPKPHEDLALAVSTSSSFDIPTSSPLATGSICSAKAVVQADHIATHPNLTIPTSGARASSPAQTGSNSSARFLALLFDFASNSHSHPGAEVDTAAPSGNQEFGEFDDTINLKDSINNGNEYGRALKRKFGSLTDDDGDEDGALEGRSGNDLNHASSSAQTGYGQPTSRPGYGMRESSLGGERDQIQSEAESMEKDDGATVEVEDVKEVDVKDEDVKMEDETAVQWKGKGKEIAGTAGDSSSMDGRASSLGVKAEEVRETASRPKEEMSLEGNEEIDRYFNVAPISSGTPRRVAVPAVASTTGNIAQNVLPVDKVERRNATAHDRREGEASTSTPQAVIPRMAATLQACHPPQRKVGPPTAGSIRIDSFLAQNDYDARGRVIIESQRNEQRRNLAPELVLAYPLQAVVGYLPTLAEVDNIYLHLQLAPLVPWRSPSNEIGGSFQHGDVLWNRVLHPNMGQILRDQEVQYPIPDIAPAYPPEADVVKFQFNKWRAQARVASYKACILGGSDSDNLAMKYLLDQRFGGNLSLGYSSPLLQVLASKLDAFGRLGMVDGVSPCRILSTSCLGRGDRAGVITRDFGEFLTFCSTTMSTKVMAGWFHCQGKISTYSYTFANRSLQVYTSGGGVDPLFQTHVQVILDCFTIILDLPPYDIDLELLHFAPHAVPKEEGPIAIVILELLVSGKVPHHCLPNMQMTEDRLEVWIPNIRLQQAQYLLDDHAAFKLLDTRLQALRRMMDGCAQ